MQYSPWAASLLTTVVTVAAVTQTWGCKRLATEALDHETDGGFSAVTGSGAPTGAPSSSIRSRRWRRRPSRSERRRPRATDWVPAKSCPRLHRRRATAFNAEHGGGDDRGRALAAAMPGAAQFAWSIVVRTCVIDRYVADAVADGYDAVVNIGAGLDTRPYRLGLPSSFQWVEIDLPSMVSYKERALADASPPTCKLERIAADLADAEQRRVALRDVAQRGRRILVLTEGVIVYLGDDDVAALARDLRAYASFASWIVDYTSPFLSKHRHPRPLQRRGEAHDGLRTRHASPIVMQGPPLT